MAVDAKMIKELRDKTGMGINDCKNALVEANGDIEQAELNLRKRQKEKAIKKADRPTGEGVIVIKVDGNAAIIAEVACEQEPTKNNDLFKAFVEKVIATGACSGAKNLDEILAADCGEGTIQEALTTLAGTVGENVQLKRFERVEAPAGGIVGAYAHFNQKAGAVVSLSLDGADAGNADLKTLANDICMHAVACRPVAVDRSGVPADLIAKEREVFLDQVKDKPEQIQEKILEGKLGKFYSERCLVEQIFVKDPDGANTVQQMIDNIAKAAGGTAKVVGYARYELGL
ncbi:MAG: translation elongation factor Ts [Planctomycetes bacterium]|nr:translation elongation factor Ts [Planctomycetota bacterium]